jgi:hypothetical protein
MRLTRAAARPTYIGIVKMEGDRLYLCYDRGTGERPTRFDSPEGSTVILIIMRRVKED